MRYIVHEHIPKFALEMRCTPRIYFAATVRFRTKNGSLPFFPDKPPTSLCKCLRNHLLRFEIWLQARSWVLSIGFTLSFGALFSKTWRVHAIFTNIKLNRKVRRRRTQLLQKDSQQIASLTRIQAQKQFLYLHVHFHSRRNG